MKYSEIMNRRTELQNIIEEQSKKTMVEYHTHFRRSLVNVNVDIHSKGDEVKWNVTWGYWNSDDIETAAQFAQLLQFAVELVKNEPTATVDSWD